ncbi:DedA family protein [Pseudomonas sp. R1-18]|uniref:YqaA family protein n=1 Tax=Pseudomonas sp. R1-18 TaxID=1632772 RepID=UPI003DAA3DDC
MVVLTGYLTLFAVAFGAATLLPLQSESVLVGMLISDAFSVPVLLVVAVTGNVLGSVVSWYLGRSIEHFRHKRWFPVRERDLDRAQATYKRFGRWALLFTWMPIIGDPITLIAGVMREPFWSFLGLVTMAKALRYLALTGLTLGWM